MLTAIDFRLLQRAGWNTPLKKLVLLFTVFLIACGATKSHVFVDNSPVLRTELKSAPYSSIIESNPTMTARSSVGDLASALLEQGYTSFATALANEGLLHAIDDKKNSWTILAPKERFATSESRINSREHIILDYNLSLDKFGKLNTITTVSGRQYNVTDIDGITTVNGLVITHLQSGESSTVLSLDGVLD